MTTSATTAATATTSTHDARTSHSGRTRLGLAALALALAGSATISTAPAAQAHARPAPVTVSATASAASDYGYLTRVTHRAGASYLTFDRAILLVGEEARRERVRRGLDPDAPDYYIVNDNPRLRSLRLAPGVLVLGSQRLTGSPELKRVPLRVLRTFVATQPQARRTTPFVLDLDSRGRVVRITEQYLA